MKYKFTNDKCTFAVEELLWADVRKSIHLLNPEFAQICDQISPDQQYPLYKLRYPYGARIVDTGEFYLPTVDGELISIKDNAVPLVLKEKLGYCAIPLSFVLHNNNEVFVETTNRVIPLNFFKPGDFFGIFESMNSITNLDLPPIWSVTAGGRSVFLIPKISDRVSHARIQKEFGITIQAPTDLLGQWNVFKEIHRAVNTKEKWYNEILVFSDKWLETKSHDKAWSNFHEHLFKISWKQSKLLRDVIEFGLLWASFSEIISNRGIKPRTYIVDTLKHLTSIVGGSGVAFRPATDDATMPVSLLQDIYVNHYNLKNYIPTFMQPCKLHGQNKTVYYSLAFPNTLESSPYTRNSPSIIDDERSIKVLLKILMDTIKSKNSSSNPFKNVEFEFFHTDFDLFGEILNTKDLVAGDDRFNQSVKQYVNNRTVCTTALFFRGCIRISTNS
jgi:hypothetical protein